MSAFGKLLIAIGGILIIIGVVIVLAGRMNLPLGRLPGDVSYRGRNTAIFFPITTCIVLSVVLSLVLWLIGRFMR